MAHTCIECGSYCTCHGDIDDIDFGEVDFCTHCPIDGGGDEECFFSGTDNIYCSKCECDSFESPIHFVNNSWLCENCTKPNNAWTRRREVCENLEVLRGSGVPKHMNFGLIEDAETVEDIQRVLDEHPDWSVAEIIRGEQDKEVTNENDDEE